MVSISICQADHPGSSPVWSVCFRKVRMLSTCSHQCRRQIPQRLSMCYHVYVIMHVKDLYLSVIIVGHRVPLAGFCRSLYGLHVLNRDVNMIQTNKQTRFTKFIVVRIKVTVQILSDKHLGLLCFVVFSTNVFLSSSFSFFLFQSCFRRCSLLQLCYICHCTVKYIHFFQCHINKFAFKHVVKYWYLQLSCTCIQSYD